jgi:CHAT domain-containing protein
LAIRRALFDPLVAFLDGRKQLFVVPDGDLARLPFEVLPTDDGQHLIDEYSISYLGVGRDVLRFGVESMGQPGPPIIAADPDFDLGSAAGRRSYNREEPFERLNGTRAEGERISALLGAEPFLGARALETHVKSSRSPRVLHLATHGFFLPNAPREPNKERLALGSVESPGYGLLAARLGHAENPLLRSGLALAGANTWLEGDAPPKEAEDGLLTAEDVTGMDLLATELVVLSACETGLGEVRVGEGVYGLRRAFVLAGAKTLVMSLWKVPDEQTRELMEDFYQRLLEGQPRAEALKEAQLAMKERYPDPLYWGAFVCQGSPNVLPPTCS